MVSQICFVLGLWKFCTQRTCLFYLMVMSLVIFLVSEVYVRGTPLSPLLFVLAEEVLSRSLEMERISNSLQPMSYCRGMSLLTHILYADAVFICCVGSKKNICCLLRVFQSYSDASGQFVNFEKSKLFTGAMTVTRRNMLLEQRVFHKSPIEF